MRILVAESEAVIRDLMVDKLEDKGHRVVSVGDGHSALRELKGLARFDHAICDYDIPGMNGLDLLRRVREDARLYELQFLLCSIAFPPEVERMARGLSASTAHKPLLMAILLNHIDLVRQSNR